MSFSLSPCVCLSLPSSHSLSQFFSSFCQSCFVHAYIFMRINISSSFSLFIFSIYCLSRPFLLSHVVSLTPTLFISLSPFSLTIYISSCLSRYLFLTLSFSFCLTHYHCSHSGALFRLLSLAKDYCLVLIFFLSTYKHTSSIIKPVVLSAEGRRLFHRDLATRVALLSSDDNSLTANSNKGDSYTGESSVHCVLL